MSKNCEPGLRYPRAAAGFDQKREGIERGNLEMVSYRSTTVGTERKMLIYTPPGYSKDRPYIFKHAPAFATFEQDLLKDVIPFVEANYSVKKDRDSRALAGLSMGGGQSLNFGLGNLDTFAWVGGFSSAPNTRPPEKLLSNPDDATKKLKLLWVSCGNQDGLIDISQRTHAYLKEKNIPHIWHVDAGKHDFKVWKNDLYLFAQRIFR